MYPKKTYWVWHSKGIDKWTATSISTYQGSLEIMDHEPEPGMILLAMYSPNHWNKVEYIGEQQVEDHTKRDAG